MKIRFNRYCFVTVLLFILCFTAHGQVRQLSQIIADLEAKYQVSVTYSDDLIQHDQLSVSFDGKTLEQALELISRYSRYTFTTLSNGQIVLKKKPTQQKRITGQLIDEETGVPQPGIAVVCNGQMIAVTDESGGFDVKHEFVDVDSISFKSTTFAEVRYAVNDLTVEPPVTIGLTSSIEDLPTLELDIYLTDGITVSHDNHGIEINEGELALLPGETAGDVLQSLQVLPGINSSNGKSGTLNIRGSTTDQTLILFDDIPIYHKGHYYGTISPFNPTAVASINVYRSGFHPKYGGRVAGTIDIATISEIPDSTEFELGANLLFWSGFIHTPIVKDKVSLLLSGRSFYGSEWNSPKLDAITTSVFQLTRYSASQVNDNITLIDFQTKVSDLNGKLTIEPNEKNIIETSFLRVYNQVNQEYFDANRPENSVAQSVLSNTGGSISWKSYLSDFLESKVTAVIADYDYVEEIEIKNPMGQFRSSEEFGNTIRDYRLLAELKKYNKSNQNDFWEIGYQFENKNLGNLVMDSSAMPSPTLSPSIDTKDTVSSHSLLMNYSLNSVDHLSITFGTRLSYYDASEIVFPEPRLSWTWDINHSFLLKGTAGLYYQYLNQPINIDFDDIRPENQIWLVAGITDAVPIVKSGQVMLGGQYKKGDWVFDLEAYYKKVNDLHVNGVNIPGAMGTTGEGNVLGTDVILKRKIGEANVWFNYSLLHNRWFFPSISDEPFRPYYDQPHVINVVMTYPWKSFKFSVRWNWKSGLPNQTVNAGSGGGGMPSLTEPVVYNGRFPNVHQLDISASYEFPKVSKGWKGIVGVSLLNVYDQENILEIARTGMPPFVMTENRTTIGFAPNINLNIRW